MFRSYGAAVAARVTSAVLFRSTHAKECAMGDGRRFVDGVEVEIRWMDCPHTHHAKDLLLLY